MRTVFEILFDDLRSIATRPFVLVVALGIALLPSLYAWVNIYGNSDPYVNTSGIRIAPSSKVCGTAGIPLSRSASVFRKDSRSAGPPSG